MVPTDHAIRRIIMVLADLATRPTPSDDGPKDASVYPRGYVRRSTESRATFVRNSFRTGGQLEMPPIMKPTSARVVGSMYDTHNQVIQ
ncbi:MAG: hypothetical protein BGO89_03740 [Candidatus Kapaibacterium thiocyanatum]|uniref:Uncharacterized protein n=1 Tax=Candidatus Kapaibacterium thiocyanatum TaxID=1895771 RepID=A0A1M3L564_9BACT|nr:MAG: hypothetical protein BGO89_03740 ['Candidatus Kapabacteria' thiocyanatum]